MIDEPIKIFVLEDTLSDQELIEEKLIERGLHPHFLYSHSKDLLSTIKAEPCVLALDFYLPGENLLDSNLIKHVKDASEDSYTIIMSSQDAKNNFIRLIKAKADDYVEKSGIQWLDELADAIEEGRREVNKRLRKNEERKQIKEELEEVRRKLNERLKKREQHNDGRAY